MTSIRIIYRASTKQGRARGRLCIRLIHLREVRAISTEHLIYKEEFDEKSQQILFSTKNDDLRRRELSAIELSLEQTLLDLNAIINSLQQNNSYSCLEIIEAYRLSKKKNSFSYFVKLLNKELEQDNKQRTARAYETLRNRIIKFNKGRDFSLDDINSSLVSGFEKQLKDEGLSKNTISFYMRNFRAIYNKAIRKQFIDSTETNVFSEVYTGVEVTRKRALSKEDINKLKTLDLDKALEGMSVDYRKKLQLARDLFLFSFYARGMSFVDLVYLKKTDISHGVISYKRRKTGQLLEVSVNRPMMEIISRYSEETRESDYIFPIIRTEGCKLLQYQSGLKIQNLRLKQLSLLADIDKRITTHVARHSWASIAKEEEVNIWIISEGLGHSSLKTTYIYLKSLDLSRLDEANRKVLKAVS